VTTTGHRWVDIVRLRLRSLWRKQEVEQELDEELRFHHDARGWSLLENLVRDVRYGLRAMLRNPLFTITAAGALAMGIGVNSAVFTMVYSLMYRPIPVAQPETMRNVHLAAFGQGSRSHFGTQYNITWDEFHSMRTTATSAELAGLAEVQMSRKDDPRPVHAQLASDNLLTLIGGRPALGRFFRPKEVSSPGAPAVLVLSNRAWKIWFGSDPGVVGQLIVLNRTPFTIIGIADGQTTGPTMLAPDVWIPLSMQAITRPGEPLITNPVNAWIQVLGRIRPGVSDSAMQAEMQLLFQNALTAHMPQRTAAVSVAPAAFFNYPWIRQKSAPIIGILFLAVGLVLIVACANVANMLLARGLVRRREIAVRLSIGASRSRVLLFTMLVSLITGAVFGLVPAWSSLRFSLNANLRTEGLDDRNKTGKQRTQFALIAVQVAVCLVLLVNAGLLVRGFQSALKGDPGQATSNLVTASFDLRQQQYTRQSAERFFANLRESAAAIPGVRSVSTTFVEPLHQQCGTEIGIPSSDGQPTRALAACDEVGPDYFRTAGIRLQSGREFTAADQKPGIRVAIIDAELASSHFGGPKALGRTLLFGMPGEKYEIVGIASNTRALDLGTLQRGKIYTPMSGLRHMEAMLVLAWDGPFASIDKELREAVGREDPNVTIRLKRVEESVRDALVPAQLASAAAGVLGVFALLLAGTGIYGVVAFSVTRRRREMGIRVALGADRSAVMRLMIWQGMQPVIAGAVIGLALAGGGAQLIRAMLYGVSPFDPVAFAGMAAILTLAALLAAAIPARTALALDPAVTLRQE